jgi:23S rRNA A1618 N6-methylase RlmF
LKVKNDTIFEDLIDINCENYQYDFMMCNPPFFKNEFENLGISNIRKPEKRHMPNSANTQKPIESIFTDGGEVGFVKKIITESIKMGKRIK